MSLREQIAMRLSTLIVDRKDLESFEQESVWEDFSEEELPAGNGVLAEENSNEDVVVGTVFVSGLRMTEYCGGYN